MKIFLFLLATIPFGVGPASAKNSCLKEVAEFAADICGALEREGISTVVTADGKLDAKANNIISKIIGSAGAEIGGKFTEEKFKNVAREQLGTQLIDVRSCKQKMVTVAVQEVCGRQQEDQSTICQFSNGWIDYRPAKALPVGASCQDGSGISGVIVAEGRGPSIPVSTICQFAGGWRDYAPILPLRVGVTCHDGNGVFGKVVAPGSQIGSRY